MNYLCILLSVLAGLWTGLLFPLAIQRGKRRQEHKAARQAGRGQEQLLDEWLYGTKIDQEDK